MMHSVLVLERGIAYAVFPIMMAMSTVGAQLERR